MRKLLLLSSFFLLIIHFLYAQDNEPKNQATEMLSRQSEDLLFGGYGQVDFSRRLDGGTSYNSSLDVSRFVLSTAYNFTSKTSLYGEIEFEHVRELWVEQAFLNHSFNDYINFRAGLILIPMGIINEYHEPPTFNGVKRPSVDSRIVPTTWREIGVGFTGRFQDAGLKYQLYLVNGFAGYKGGNGLITGSNFLRSARQRGAETIMTSPDLSFKLDYYGIPGLKLGGALYHGKTESTLFDGIDTSDDEAVEHADSSVVGLTMTGLDARYTYNALSVRGEFILAVLRNTGEYNAFTGKDAGSAVRGMYAEVAYNVLHNTSSEYKLTPFFRYENYDTHFKVPGGTVKNESYMVNEFVFGAGLTIGRGAVIKTDLQLLKLASEDEMRTAINAGIGFWF